MKPFLVIFIFFAVANAYVFDCLDKCECDTNKEVIHCDDEGRTKLVFPNNERLRGFSVISLSFNNIIRLPDEKSILDKFPDVEKIDVERNPGFDCASLKNYEKIEILSDCSKSLEDILRVPKILRPTRECDFGCRVRNGFGNFQKYLVNLWETMKEKYRNFNLNDTLQHIQQFFTDTFSRFRGF
ncbi:unnamed protein product [Caenorhabditis angaria]|uniref:Uncharacterized protein n=1 Tax=Caenorhabditis angaria TaxID=860376 RepID=A0A9P1IX51_9PELO|nr:unnamed protein product [Caenorhabditis angaria]